MPAERVSGTLRWEFGRYDHRRHGVSYSRGWLLYVGVRPVLFVWGFHRGILGGYGYGARYNGRPHAWFEFTFYGPEPALGKSVYPKCRIPRAWL